MDRSDAAVGTNPVERRALHLTALNLVTGFRMLLSVVGVGGRKTRMRYLIKTDDTGCVSNRGGQVHVVRPLALKLAKVFLTGFDVDAMPATIIEGFGHRIDYWILGSNVDI